MSVIGVPVPALPPGGVTAGEGLVLVTPPTDVVVSFADMKRHLRLDGDTDQLYVESLVAAATAFCEAATASSLTARTYRATFRACERLVLARGPILEIISIVDAGGIPIDCGRTDDGFRVELHPRVRAARPYEVTYRAGRHDAMMRLTVMQIAATSYRNAESATDAAKVVVPHAADAYLKLCSRMMGVG